MIRWASLLFAVILVVSAAFAGEIKPPVVGDHEEGKQEKRFVGNDELIMEIAFTHDKMVKDGKTLVKRKVDAVWHLSKEPIPFTEESVLELTADGLRTLSWKKTSYGDENETWTTDYDWDAGKIHTTWTARDTGKTKKDTIDIEGAVVSGDCFELVLRGFPFEKGAGHSLKASILTPDGKLQKGTVTLKGTEVIDTAFGKLDTYALEVDPGILPKMNYYVTVAAPHVLVLEKGLEFAGILPKKADQKLLSFKPAEWVTP